jgi:tetratricopeptide (TPR) repeat protein
VDESRAAPAAGPADDDPLPRARALAGRGEWARLRAALAPRCAAEGPPADAVGAELALLLAEAELRLGDAAGAGRRLPGVVRRLEWGDDPALLRRAVNLLGVVHFGAGDLAAAEAAFARAVALGTDAGDDLLVARATNNLGAIANLRGRRALALSHYHHSEAAYLRAGDARGLAGAYHNMAITYRDLGHLGLADERERRAIEFAQQAGDARAVAIARTGRAELQLMCGDAALAAAAARIAAATFAALPDPVSEADALRLVGVAYTALGTSGRALEPLGRAVALARGHGGALVEAEALLARGRAHAALDDREAAAADARDALAMYERLGASSGTAEAAAFLAVLGGGAPPGMAESGPALHDEAAAPAPPRAPRPS